jgi:hypothetical protein
MATQGSRNNQVINLDSIILGQRLARPQKVFLFAREWTVRRDLDGAEVIDFWSYVTENKSVEAMKILVGEADGEVFSRKLFVLPLAMYQKIFTNLIQIAGIRRGDEPEDATGESTASSPGS